MHPNEGKLIERNAHFMKEKKHIDELFKARFENFEATPSPQVWDNIQAQLKEEKEDRKVIPIWWKLAGIAALLALLFTVGKTIFATDTIQKESEIVTTEETIKDSQNESDKKIQVLTDAIENSEMASEDNIEQLEDASERNSINHNAKQKVLQQPKEAVQTSIATQENKTKKVSEEKTNNAIQPQQKQQIIVNNERDAVAASTSEEKNKKLIPNNPLIKKDVAVFPTIEKEAVAQQEQQSKTTNEIIKKDAVVVEKTNTDIAATKVEENKKSIYDAIEEQNTVKTENAVAKNNTPNKRWDVAPNFAPVYYGSADGGSSIDPSFADNKKDGDVNFSYGVQVSYNITNRLSLRSGVSNVDLSYATGDIEIGSGPIASALRTIDYGNREIVVTAADKGSYAMQEDGSFGNITPKSTASDAQINQNITYYEVPLELKYAVINKKIGVNFIGGFSTLFLGNNEVSVSAQDFNSVLGEANNLSSVSFTTNVGIGFDYKLSRKFKFNIEPMFKYQLNPYTDSSVGFKPYYVGVYTGMSWSF